MNQLNLSKSQTQETLLNRETTQNEQVADYSDGESGEFAQSSFQKNIMSLDHGQRRERILYLYKLMFKKLKGASLITSKYFYQSNRVYTKGKFKMKNLNYLILNQQLQNDLNFDHF